MATAGHTLATRLRAATALACLVTGLVMLVAGGAVAVDDTTTRTVGITTVDGVISPVVDSHLADSVTTAAADGHEALIVLLDTPGGLVSSMRSIVQTFLDAPLPVVVYVSPTGADAGSAGTFITYAAHIAAMAPATTIGAATPVSLEGGEVDGKIVENAAALAEAIADARDRDVDFAIASVRDGRSVTADEALAVGAIDLIAPSLDQLLVDIDGVEVEVGDAPRQLATAGARVVELEMTGAQRLLQTLADPNLAFIFLSLGTLAILYEIANPGLGLGGVVGVVSLVLAMFSLSVLPVNYAGAALMVLAAAMFIAELFMPGIGVGAAGGTAALLVGGLFLFPSSTGIGVDWWVLVPAVVVMLGLSVFAGVMVAKARNRPSHAGSDDLVGARTTVEVTSGGRPRGKVGGTLWRLLPEAGDAPLEPGVEVTIIRRDNIDLIVRRTADHDEPPGRHGDEEQTWTAQ